MKPEIADGKLEIEHKFLIKQPLDITIEHTKFFILQDYLQAEKGCSERVRLSINLSDLSQTFTYTKKVPKEIGALEFEKEISREKYQELLKLKDLSCRRIIKTRTVFYHKGLKFELDNFAEPIQFSMVEIEVEKLLKNIDFPSFIEVIAEVTKESGFTNGSIGRDPLLTKKKIRKLKDDK